MNAIPRERKLMAHLQKTVFLCTALFFIFFSRPCEAQSESERPCRDNVVIYEAPPPFIQKNIEIARLLTPADISPDKKKTISPQSTRWFVEVDPDYTKTEPHVTTLYIGSPANEKAFLKARFSDYGNTFSAEWLNEKLIFIQVSWGHVLSSELILDVDEGKFIYNETANYSELVEPCRADNPNSSKAQDYPR
jgi:hypothetical protein